MILRDRIQMGSESIHMNYPEQVNPYIQIADWWFPVPGKRRNGGTLLSEYRISFWGAGMF
jgi:hypothetical protein